MTNVRWLMAVGAVLSAAAFAAEPIRGRTGCGAYQLEISVPRFDLQVCDGATRADGRIDGSSAVLEKLHYRDAAGSPRELALRVPSFSPQDRSAVEALAKRLDLLTSFKDVLPANTPSSPPSGLEQVANVASLERGCEGMTSVAAVADFRTSVTGTGMYVPPQCVVIVFGRVQVQRLVVDGLFIRLGGGITADAVATGALTTAILGGSIRAYGANVAGAARKAINAGSAAATLGGPGAPLDLDLGPGALKAREISLQGGSIDVESVECPVVRSRGGSISSTADATGNELFLTEKGALSARSVRFPTVDARGESSVSAAGALVARTINVQGSTVSADELTADFVGANGGLVTGGTFTAPKITGNNAGFGGGQLNGKTLTTTGGVVHFGVAIAEEVRGDGTAYQIGQRLTVRTGPGTVRLTRGALNAGGGLTGDLGFAGCAQHAPFVDATTLETSGTTIYTAHLRVDGMQVLGGAMHANETGSGTLCVEVARTSKIDQLPGSNEPLPVRGARIYASLADARIGALVRIDVSGHGDGPVEGDLVFPGETGNRLAGASFGGFGGTAANLNDNTFQVAEQPGARPDAGMVQSPVDFREGGLGAWQRLGSKGGWGGGAMRLRATRLQLDGQAMANARELKDVPGGSGGTGGSIFVEAGTLLGRGLLQVNGADGWYGNPSFTTGAGGSGGRIRIDYADRGGWTGRTETLGGRGGHVFGDANEQFKHIPAWDDRRNHGGPGTVYWKRGVDGPGEIVIESALDDGQLRGVGFLAGKYPADTLIIRKAVVACDDLQLGGLRLEQGAVLAPNNARVRVEFPPAHQFYAFRGGTHGAAATQTIYPLAMWQEPLTEALTLDVEGDVAIDASSRIDLTGFGGSPRAASVRADAWRNVAGGSHGGLGGAGRSGNPNSLGVPSPARGNPIEPTEPGEGGLGEVALGPSPKKIHSLGGGGGGVLRLNAKGALRVDGQIRADGANGQTQFQDYEEQGSGAGAGGSVWISGRSLSGKGRISASGGAGTAHAYYGLYGGGGGGGRIRLDLSDRAGWKGQVVAAGGAGASLSAAKSKATGKPAWSDSRMGGGPGSVYWNLGATRVLAFDGAESAGGVGVLNGDFPGVEVRIVGAPVMSRSLKADALVLERGATLLAEDQRFPLHGLVRPGSQPAPPVLLWADPSSATLDLSLVRLTIDGKSRIDASGTGGWARADDDCGRGAYANRAGGSHAGEGGPGEDERPNLRGCPSKASTLHSEGEGGFGRNKAVVGGYTFQPCESGGSGGGVVSLAVAGLARVDGQVRVDGVAPPPPQSCKEPTGHGGGAGGTLTVTAGELVGKGELSASGGAGSADTQPPRAFGGGGGGGHVSVAAQKCGFAGRVIAVGGAGGSAAHSGKPGAVSADGCRAIRTK